MSSSNEEVDQKKKSQAIDKILEEDSKRLRKECKILLLGRLVPRPARAASLKTAMAYIDPRFRRKWQVDNCQADEDNPPPGVFRG